MKTFREYLTHVKTIADYCLPDHFMSFTEMKWVDNDTTNPNGILLFPIVETMKFWKDGKFTLYGGAQDTIHVVKTINCSLEYTEDQLKQDIEKLRELYKKRFEPNVKLVSEYQSRIDAISAGEETTGNITEYQNLIDREVDKIDWIIYEATQSSTKPSKKLWELTKWIAANGKDPAVQFSGNAPQRWTSVFKSLGYTGFAFENVAIFFGLQDLERVDEIRSESKSRRSRGA